MCRRLPGRTVIYFSFVSAVDNVLHHPRFGVPHISFEDPNERWDEINFADNQSLHKLAH